MPDNYKRLIDIMNKINSSISYQHLLLTIIDSAKELLNSEGASLLLLDQERGELIFDIVLSEKGEVIRGKRIKVGVGIAGYVAATGEDIIVNDVHADPRFYSDIDTMSGFRTRSLVATPVRVKGRLIGVLEAANALSPGGFTPNELSLLKYLADAASISINNQELMISLKNRAEELTCIYEITQSIYFTFDVDEFLKRILGAVNKVIRAERCSFVVLDESGTAVRHYVSTTGEKHEINLDNSLMAHVIRTGDPLLVYNIEKDSKVVDSARMNRDYSTKSFICVPMKFRDRVIGVLNVTDKRHGDVFDSFDLRVLSTVANHVAETYENLLLQKKLVEGEKLDKELAIAADIQANALSAFPERIDGALIGAFTIPSSAVGGDFFEISMHDDGTFSAGVGDVSGKGIPAAIFMSMVRNTIRFESTRDRDPATLMKRVNRWVYQEARKGMFCTYFSCHVDTGKRVLHYCSAGHDNQLFYRKKEKDFIILKTKGGALGAFAEMRFENQSMPYEPGDLLILFTDGLIEKGANRPFTLESIMDCMRGKSAETPSRICENIKSSILSSYRDEYSEDDITLLVIRFA